MTLSLSPQKIADTIDARLDEFEESLPALPAKVLHLQRATARAWMERSDAFWSGLGDTVETVLSTARTAGRTVFGQARAAVEDVVETTQARASRVTGETRRAVSDISETTRRSARTVRGQAAAQGRRTVRAADRATERALDSAIDAVEDKPGSGQAYETWSRADLLERATELKIPGRYQMKKAELIKALRAA
jgi:hypothetical protein